MRTADVVADPDGESLPNPRTETANDQSQHVRWILTRRFERAVEDSGHLFRCKRFGVLILGVNNREIDVLAVPGPLIDFLTVKFQGGHYKLARIHDVSDGFGPKLFLMESLYETFERIVVN